MDKDQYDLTKPQRPDPRKFVIIGLDDWVQSMNANPTGDDKIKRKVFRDVGSEGTRMRFLNSRDWARSHVHDLSAVLTSSSVGVLLFAVGLPFPLLGTPHGRIALLTYKSARVIPTSLPPTKGSEM